MKASNLSSFLLMSCISSLISWLVPGSFSYDLIASYIASLAIYRNFEDCLYSSFGWIGLSIIGVIAGIGLSAFLLDF